MSAGGARKRSADRAVRARLADGAGRTLGAANALAERAAEDADILAGMVATLTDDRAEVRHRAANALKKVQRREPERLLPFGRAVLRAACSEPDLRTRWNLVDLLGALALKGGERALAVDLLFEACGSPSAILRCNALESLARIAGEDAALAARVRVVVEAAQGDPSAAVRARARRLAKSDS